MPTGPLHTLGRFAHDLTWSQVPEPAQRRARLALRDTLGCMLGGATTPAGRIASSVADSTGSAQMAAFAAAVHASALDFDDGHYRGGAIHPSAVIVPTLLVASRSLRSIGREQFSIAQIVGYEIGLRGAHLLWPRHALDDYHCTGTAATLGAAAAAARLRGGDIDQISRAIAIAWAHAPMATFQLPMVKESIGWSAATALAAADLAEAGFMAVSPGDESALDRTFPPTPFHRVGAMEDPFVTSLGTRFETEHTYFKPYAACRYTHTALRSLEELIAGRGLSAATVRSIEVYTPQPAMNLTDTRPASLDHAQYSFPFVLASMLLTGRAGAQQISNDTLHDPQRLAIADNVTVRHDPELDPTYPEHYATRLVVHTHDGATHQLTRLVAPGDAEDPLTEQQLADKFVRLAEPVHHDLAGALADELNDPHHAAFAELLTRTLGK